MRKLLGVALALVGILGANHSAAAQGVNDYRVMFTPIIGVRGAVQSGGDRVGVAVGDLVASRFEWGSKAGGGIAVGGEIDIRFLGPLGVAGMGLYLGADDIRYLTEVNRRVVSEGFWRGPEVAVVAAGLSIELPGLAEGPAGFLMFGPALVRQDYSGSVFNVSSLDPAVDSYGAWIGYRGLFETGVPWAAFSLTVEDIVPFWDRSEEGARLRSVLGSEIPFDGGLGGAGHLPMARIGIAIQL